MSKLDGVEHAKKLWILEQVLEGGSFRAAALRAKVSTPAISQAVASLERLVGKPLIVRKKNAIAATETAVELLTIARPAIQALRELRIRPESPAGCEIAWISLGACESLAIGLLPKLTQALRAKFPKLKLTARVAGNLALAGMVRKGELCAAVVEENDGIGRLLAVPLAQDRLGFYLSSKTPRSERRWDAARTAGELAILAPGPEGYPRYYRRLIRTAFGKAFKPAMLSDSYEVLRASAASGACIAVLPTLVANRPDGALVEITPPELKELGAHRILLISQPNCDPEEIQLLTSELTPLLPFKNDS